MHQDLHRHIGSCVALPWFMQGRANAREEVRRAVEEEMQARGYRQPDGSVLSTDNQLW